MGSVRCDRVRARCGVHVSFRVVGVTRLDSPCIAVCTTLYDDYCKGCGRHYAEVAHWSAMGEKEREEVWQRIDAGATSWRYNRYKDRVPA